jgi:hypothetical protein
MYINIKAELSPHIDLPLSPAFSIRNLPYVDSMHLRFISRDEANTRAKSYVVVGGRLWLAWWASGRLGLGAAIALFGQHFYS